MTLLKTAAFVSGSGTLLEATLKTGLLPINLVIADRPCRGLSEVAPSFGVRTKFVGRAMFGGFGRDFDREAYTSAIEEVLAHEDIGVFFMLGFDTILSAGIFEGYYKGRGTNNHPSLLPLFPGHHAVADTLAAGAKESGCTIHVATAKVDDATTILAQETVPVLPNDTKDTLHQRIKEVEWRITPPTLAAFHAKLQAAL